MTGSHNAEREPRVSGYLALGGLAGGGCTRPLPMPRLGRAVSFRATARYCHTQSNNRKGVE
jgi:hypothetical protein